MDTLDYTIAGALQQVQLITIKDLQGMRVYKRLLDAHKKGEPVLELVARLSKEHNN